MGPADGTGWDRRRGGGGGGSWYNIEEGERENVNRVRYEKLIVDIGVRIES